MPARSRPQTPLLLSTDINGVINQSLDNYYQLYQTIDIDVCPLDGVEFLPFRFNHASIYQQLKKMKVPLTALHGSVGWNHPGRPWLGKLYGAIFATGCPSFNHSFSLALAEKPKYLLFHQPDFTTSKFKQLLKNYLEKQPGSILMIENVYDRNSLQLTVKTANHYQNQTRAGVMIDLVHLLREVVGAFKPFQDYRHLINNTNFDRHWQTTLKKIDQACQQLAIVGFHIPLGENLDSLPWKLMRESHWQELARIMDRHQAKIKFLVIENQHPEAILALKNKDLAQIMADKKEKLSQLVAWGVI